MNFALAMERFDPRIQQPHPPGYFLYVEVRCTQHLYRKRRVSRGFTVLLRLRRIKSEGI